MRRPTPVVLTLSAAALAAVIVLVAAAVLRVGPFATSGPAPALPAPRFAEDTPTSGLALTYAGPFVYAVGGGVTVFDCDDDGRPDVYLAGGEGKAGLFRNISPTGGSITFAPVADPAVQLDKVNGAYALDVDNDGITDLITLRYGENVALRGLGDCRFERANEAWHLDGGAELTEAFSATWERGATWPTIAFGNYADPASQDFETWCQANELVRPSAAPAGGATAGGGPIYAAPIELTPAYCTLSMLFSDWDGSGRRDLRISNDRHYYVQALGQEQLWRIEPGATPRLYTSDDGWTRVQVEGMGIASQDLTGDGLPEVYLTSQAASKLQTLAEGASTPAYKDIGLPYGVNVAHPFTGNDMDLPSTAWHPEFADVNNDGFVDLFVSKGSITGQADFAVEDPSNLLIGQPAGPFVEGAQDAGILAFEFGRGAALVDFNLDGRLDLIESFYGTPARVWRSLPAGGSEAPYAHWLALRLEQASPNVDAIGAVIEVRAGAVTWRRELTVGGGHAGGQLGWVHIGLGSATSAEVRVRWPDGELGPWQPLAANGFGIVTRGASSIEGWTPPS